MNPPEPTPDVPLRVLLVDDDEDDFRLTRAVLKEIPGRTVTLDWVSDFDEALETVCRSEHDAYLIDYRLGAKTGLDLIAAVKERQCSGPIVLLTGQGQVEIDRAAELAGAADYLEKSRLNPIVLERTIRYAIRQHAQEAELERKVQARTLELEAANKALQDADRRKDEFLATLAHELRNPLAPIRNALEIQRMVTGDADATGKARALIERQVLQMVRLIDDLLDASRLSRGKLRLDLEPIDLREALSTAIETSLPLIEKAGLNFEQRIPHRPLPIQGDLVRLAQLFTNLLNNAAKYTPSGGRVLLRAHADDTNVHITVSDTGLGIPAEFLPKVFDLFTQVDRSLKRFEGGLGIGLALVRKIVEMHGGQVAAESEGSNRGAVFTVTLPIHS